MMLGGEDDGGRKAWEGDDAPARGADQSGCSGPGNVAFGYSEGEQLAGAGCPA
jgi:hypothetical protein